MKRLFYKLLTSYIVVIALLTSVLLFYSPDNISVGEIIVIIIAVIAAIFLSYFFVKDITKPIASVVAATKKVARGDFSQRIEITSKDDTRMLLENMNYMIEHLQYLFDRLKEEKEDKENLIRSLHDGFIIVDESGLLISANEAFAQISGVSDFDGKYFWEIIRNDSLDDYFREISHTHADGTIEIEFNDKFYFCSISYSKFKNQFIIILYDISERKRLEKVKKDFIVNVSHELRTPLTAIKGFVETLEEDASGENLHYLGIIGRHTDRLINIVNDLLTLSELEDESMKLIPGRIRLSGFFDSILTLYKSAAEKKNIVIKCEVNPVDLTIFGDTFKLEQVFVNLVDNAVKYTDSGEVKIKAFPAEAGVKIEVSDTGIGIPAEQTGRIFERFYVVDKSRSRKVGGTGLGLSIVKHIILLHHGTIEVESHLGTGTKFTIFLPNRVI